MLWRCFYLSVRPSRSSTKTTRRRITQKNTAQESRDSIFLMLKIFVKWGHGDRELDIRKLIDAVAENIKNAVAVA